MTLAGSVCGANAAKLKSLNAGSDFMLIITENSEEEMLVKALQKYAVLLDSLSEAVEEGDLDSRVAGQVNKITEALVDCVGVYHQIESLFEESAYRTLNDWPDVPASRLPMMAAWLRRVRVADPSPHLSPFRIIEMVQEHYTGGVAGFLDCKEGL